MKTIIITGADGHLGTATVRKFLAEGYRVVAVDKSGSNLEITRTKGEFELHALDLSNEDASEKFVNDIISRHGTIEGGLMLVGGFAMGGIETTTGADLKKMYSLNFETAYFLARPLFRHMIQKGYGRLVFIGARPAIKPSQGKGTIAYALSKSLLFNLADILNAQAKEKNVVASVVVPSTIDTELNRKSMPEADPGNWVKAEQIAEVLEFICSEKGLPLREPVYKVYNNG